MARTSPGAIDWNDEIAVRFSLSSLPPQVVALTGFEPTKQSGDAHRVCSPMVDWPGVAAIEPGARVAAERAELFKLSSKLERPSTDFRKWLFGAPKRFEEMVVRYEQLNELVHRAVEWDNYRKNVAGQILVKRPEAYRHALEVVKEDGYDRDSHLGPIWSAEGWYASTRLDVDFDELDGAQRHRREDSWSGIESGQRYWPRIFEGVCSVALRAARELFALLPIDQAFIHVYTACLDNSDVCCVMSLRVRQVENAMADFTFSTATAIVATMTCRVRYSTSDGFSPVSTLVPVEYR